LGISLSALGRWVRAERKPSANQSVTKKPSLSLADQDELIRLRKENEQLRMAREILKKADVFFAKAAEYPQGTSKVRVYLCPVGIQAQQKTYPVTVLCRVVEVGTSAFYAGCNTAATRDTTQQDQVLSDKIRQIFSDNKYCFGSRRLSDRLKKQGFAIGRFKTRRIMRELNLKVRYPKRFKVTTDSYHNETVSV
jgi:hypothetical protein